MKIFYILFFVFSLFISKIYSAEVFEVNGNLDEINLKIISALGKISKYGFIEKKRTKGFQYTFKNGFFYPYRLQVYTGTFLKSKNLNLVRIESSYYGQEKMYKKFIAHEVLGTALYKEDFPRFRKWHSISQVLNLISPAASVTYNAFMSPVYKKQDWAKKTLSYLFLDIVVAGGAYYYLMNEQKHKSLLDDMLLKKGPSKNIFEMKAGEYKIGFLIVAVLLASRIYRTKTAYQDTYVHNRFRKLGQISYTHRF